MGQQRVNANLTKIPIQLLTDFGCLGSENSIFAMGQKTQEGSQGGKKGNPIKTGEERLDTLDIKNDKKDAKKERDKYAVNLRKQRR